MRRTLSRLYLFAAIAAVTLAARSGAADEFKLENGFTLLFNGTDLTGWKMSKGGEALDGKTEAAKGRFVVKDGAIVIDPKVKGDLRIHTAKEFGKDAHIKFEYRPGNGCNNDLFFRGTKFDLKTPDVKNLKEGEWNQFEIIVTGDSAEFKNNGETQKKLKAKPEATPLEIRAEFGPIEIRRLRIKSGT